jgi:antitoxin component YwqK of YwqJK toxin-antitoxin module
MKGNTIKSVNLLCAIPLIFCLLVCTGCSLGRQGDEPVLTSLSLIDRNNFSETISAPERLEKFADVDFLCNQPYQRVLRVYERDDQGNIAAFVTSYHSNGQPKQYLEIVNGRAFGKYQEWYLNGQLMVDTQVIGGLGDISPAAEQTWLFEGCNSAWDDDGNLKAEIYYQKGQMQGLSFHYHPNGKIWKKVPYQDNLIEGMVEIYLDNGDLLATGEYSKGVRHGKSLRYWPSGSISTEEFYSNGLLHAGSYYNPSGEKISEVKGGEGARALFSKSGVSELHQYKEGVPAGEIKVFDGNGRIIRLYHVKGGLKHGEEIEYFLTPMSSSSTMKPKISINWYEGKIQGMVKTWFENGGIESQREMSKNVKNGMLTCWYRDGNLMLIEEYDNDKLVRGEYYKKGDRTAVSQIYDGKGVATIFDSEGNFVRKANYAKGRLVE